MRVFITGATGFIGSKVVRELIDSGHSVLGLTRSDSGAEALIAAGAEVHRGELEDLGSLRSGAAQSDAVIHTAFIHDFSKFAESSEVDKRAIEALGAELAGSGRPLIVSSGIPGAIGNEDADPPANSRLPRVSEQAAMALIPNGVSAGVVRLPQVHDTVKQGLVTRFLAIAREKGVSAYVEEGSNRWAAAHVLDVARLYRLALEHHKPGVRYHAVGEEGVAVRDIANALGRGLKVPVISLSREEANAHFGPFGWFAVADNSTSSTLTQERLGWRPVGPGLISDLDNMNYSVS